MPVRDRIADVEIEAVYMWGAAKLVRDEARRTKVVDLEMIPKLQATMRDLRAAANYIEEAWKMMQPVSEAAE